MTLDDWTTSTAPKIIGSQNLDQLLPRGLDFFVLLSSLVGIVGAQGQSNYAAGNAFQDSLARCRVSRGEKAVSLDLGMIVDEGTVADDEALARTMGSFGHYQPMTTSNLEALLERYCDPSLRVLPADECQVVCGIRSPKALRALGFKEPGWMSLPMFRAVHLLDQSSESSTATVQESFQDALQAATSLQEAADLVVDALITKLAALLGIAATDLDPSRPIHLYGVDSLVAVELRNWFANNIRADVAVLHILGNTSTEALGLIAVEKSHYTQALRS